MEPCPYVAFKGMPDSFSSIKEWFSIYYNLEPYNTNYFLERFGEGTYLSYGLEAAKKLKEAYRNMVIDINSLSEFIRRIHYQLSAWRKFGIWKFIIDLTPVALEDPVTLEEISELQKIKETLGKAVSKPNSLFMTFMERAMEFFRENEEKVIRELKPQYRKWFEKKMACMNSFHTFMASFVLQVVYGYPAGLRLVDEVKPVEVRNYLIPKVKIVARGASPGKARGTVVKADIVEEAVKKLEQVGDPILVAPKTNPEWTPLFEKIVAVITATGGLLSHAAIVSRELGIPCVVGAEEFYRIARDGMVVEVDGSRAV